MSLKNCGRMEAVFSAAFFICFIITGSKLSLYIVIAVLLCLEAYSICVKMIYK